MGAHIRDPGLVVGAIPRGEIGEILPVEPRGPPVAGAAMAMTGFPLRRPSRAGIWSGCPLDPGDFFRYRLSRTQVHTECKEG